MINANFNLKQPLSNTETPIKLILRWNNQKLSFNTQEKVHPQYFESTKGKKGFQRIKSSYIGHPEFNVRLDFIEGVAKSAYRQFLNDNHRFPTPEELKVLLNSKLRDVNVPEKPKESFFQFVESFITESEKTRINGDSGKKLSIITIRIYRNTLRRLREYEKSSRRKIDFDTIDLDFYDGWINFLSTNVQHSKNTIGKLTTTLKVFLNEATERGINTNLIFKSKRFKVTREPSTSIYLNEHELMEMYKLDLSHSKRLDRTRDLFIVGCWTGLRFTDLVNIKPENIKGDKIEIKTHKTGEVVVLPIHKMVKEIMEKHKDSPNSLPRGTSNFQMNKSLKDVAKLMESLNTPVQFNITKGGKLQTTVKPKYEMVTVHTARRSFATNLYKDGVNSLTIAKLTGHKSERVFLSYLKDTAHENASLLQNHWEKKEQTTI
jgi:integrase